MMSASEFIKKEISIWGEDYIYDLIDRGFEPILITNGVTVKWTWRLTQGNICANMVSGRRLLPFSLIAD